MNIIFTDIELPQAPLELQEKIQEYNYHGYELLIIQKTSYSTLPFQNYKALLYNGSENVVLRLDEGSIAPVIKAESFFDHSVAWVMMFSSELRRKMADIPVIGGVSI